MQRFNRGRVVSAKPQDPRQFLTWNQTIRTYADTATEGLITHLNLTDVRDKWYTGNAQKKRPLGIEYTANAKRICILIRLERVEV